MISLFQSYNLKFQKAEITADIRTKVKLNKNKITYLREASYHL
jgi:hypothetical protein